MLIEHKQRGYEIKDPAYLPGRELPSLWNFPMMEVPLLLTGTLN